MSGVVLPAITKAECLDATWHLMGSIQDPATGKVMRGKLVVKAVQT
jgi:hypothetical protein